ncbi:MAG: hypothetical protein KDA28_11925, partial [Phycisphaerales bacterium]|nr:hypothetical protein [Phycisphaerales bacterium]
WFEALEGRRLLATFTVDTLLDEIDGNFGAGDLSLREAVQQANLNPGADVVLFDAALAGGVIDMRFLGQIDITDDLTIGTSEGEAVFVRLDTHGSSRHFSVDDGDDASLIDVAIHRLALLNGSSANAAGGSIISAENLTLVETEIINARVGGENGGGALYQRDAQATLHLLRSTISGSEAHLGGAAFIFESNAIIESSALIGNAARESGGALFTSGGASLHVEQSTIASNTAAVDGGGLTLNFTGVEIRGSTIVHNVADVGGSTDGLGGGILAIGSGTVTLESTIVAHNRAANVPSELMLTGVASVNASHTLVMDASTASTITHGQDGNLVGVDPALTSVASLHGGTTVTWGLLEGSPAIDAGIDTIGATTDQRGGPFARTFGASPDIGAYERQTLALVVDATTRGDDLDLSTGAMTIDEALRLANGNLGRDLVTLPTGTIEAGATLRVTDDLDLQGQTMPSSILQGALGATTIEVGSGVRLAMERLTIRDGTGSALLVDGGDLSLELVSFLDHAVTGAHGVVEGDGATFSMRNVTFQDNTVEDGAALVLQGSGAVIEGASMSFNIATGASGAGAIRLVDSTLQLEHSTLLQNEGMMAGALVADADSNVTIERTFINGNVSASDG